MKFFDRNEVLYPWPLIFRRSGLSLPYKPREVWWKSYIEDLNLKKGQKVLEVGCGRGILLDRITKEYQVKASGIDIASLALKDAREQGIYEHDLHCSSASKLPLKDNTFDALLSFDTLEHVGDQKKAVLEFKRVLKPGGKFLIYTINSNQFLTWDWILSKLGVDIYKRVDHNPNLFLNPKKLKIELENIGLKVEGIDYFNSFFTLIADETIMIIISFWKKFFGWKRTEKSGTIILRIFTFFSIITTPVLRLFEFPWRAFGYSNGFLLIGQKK